MAGRKTTHWIWLQGIETSQGLEIIDMVLDMDVEISELDQSRPLSSHYGVSYNK